MNTMLITHVSYIILWALDLYLILLNVQIFAHVPYLIAYSSSMVFQLHPRDTLGTFPTIFLVSQKEFLKYAIHSPLGMDVSLMELKGHSSGSQHVFWILKTPMSCLVGKLEMNERK